MRWKFWKKVTPPAQPDAEAQLAPPQETKKSRRGKRRHFEASCIAGTETGDEEFVFEGFERGAASSLQQPQPLPPPSMPLAPTQLPQQHQQLLHELRQQPLLAPLPPPRKKESHTLPRFLRRAASAGRKASTAATETDAATSAAAVADAPAAVEKTATSSDEGFPSTSSGDLLSAEDDTPLAYCPHCRAVVRPLTMMKRSQIRTNPWVKERKRPRVDVVIQKSLDSGIYDGNNRARGSAEAATVAAAAESAKVKAATSDEAEEEEEEEPETIDIDGDRPVSLASQPELDSSDGSETPVSERRLQPKRKVRRKRRRRQQSLDQQLQHEQQQWPQFETPYGSTDEDFAAIHASAMQQTLSIVDEGIACIGFVPQQQQLMATAEITPVSMSSGDSSSLWWDMDRRHLLLMAPPPDTSSSSGSLNLTDEAARLTPVLHSETEFDSPPESETGDSSSELEFRLLPDNREVEAEEESLAETVQRLTAQRDSLERRFREPPFQQPQPQQPQQPQCGFVNDNDGFFARELERYRRELLLRALASVRDQLDCQMSRLERACSDTVDRQVRLARENFLRQVSDPCSGRRIGGGDGSGGGAFLTYSAAVEAQSGERVSYH